MYIGYMYVYIFVTTACPDILTDHVTTDHEFIILACDGIWDVMTNYEVVRFIRTRIAQSIMPEQVSYTSIG